MKNGLFLSLLLSLMLSGCTQSKSGLYTKVQLFAGDGKPIQVWEGYDLHTSYSDESRTFRIKDGLGRRYEVAGTIIIEEIPVDKQVQTFKQWKEKQKSVSEQSRVIYPGKDYVTGPSGRAYYLGAPAKTVKDWKQEKEKQKGSNMGAKYGVVY